MLPPASSMRGRSSPDIAVLKVSARSSAGMVGWIDWLINATERAGRGAERAVHGHA
jgi:hypothetical protein